ncbi:MAG: 30S ribosomal protein S8 [Patescibacteria group bacterium]
MTSDPISDFVTRLKNSVMAGRAGLEVPYSTLKMEISKVLMGAGYLQVAVKKGRRARKLIDIQLPPRGEGRKINGLERVSKPSRRVYWHARDLRPVKHGLGLVVMSTPRGVMTGDEARRSGVGGEALFKIW